MNTDHEKYMREALKEARRAEAEGEIPIGAVVVCEGRIIARAHNQTETLHDPTAHAEMLAMTAATAYPGAQPDRNPPRPHGPRRDAGHDGRHRLHRRQVPPGMHSLRHCRALPDVRRCDGLDPGRSSSLRSTRPKARLHPLLPFPPPSEDEGLQRSAVRRVQRL